MTDLSEVFTVPNAAALLESRRQDRENGVRRETAPGATAFCAACEQDAKVTRIRDGIFDHGRWIETTTELVTECCGEVV